MADINRVILTGRIGTDVELKSTQSGTSVCTFRLAVERQKAKDAEKAETDWLDMVAWRQQAEFISRYMAKGRKIVVDASVRTRVWDDKDGNKRKAVEFIVNQVVPADSKPQGATAGTSQGESAATYAQPPFTDFTEIDPNEDLPF